MVEAVGRGVEAAGAVVAIEDHMQLADALVDRLTDPAKAEHEGDMGRQRVEARFDRRRVDADVARLTTSLTSDGQRPKARS